MATVAAAEAVQASACEPGSMLSTLCAQSCAIQSGLHAMSEVCSTFSRPGGPSRMGESAMSQASEACKTSEPTDRMQSATADHSISGHRRPHTHLHLKTAGKLVVWSISAVPPGYAKDMSKFNGFRVGLSWQEATLSMLDPTHNEFWNIVTDLLPAIFLCTSSASIGFGCAAAGDQLALRDAFVATTLASAFQHFCSLAAHAFSCVSPRMSHAIWYIDYAGIVLEFVWNAPAIGFVALPRLQPLWRVWACANGAATALILGLTLRLVCTYVEPKRAPGTVAKGANWKEAFFGQGVVSLVGFLLFILPNFALTAVAAATDATALLVLAALPMAILVKEAHLPERLAPPGRFDRSVLHSHCLWHLCVCVLQGLYFVVLTNALHCAPALDHGLSAHAEPSLLKSARNECALVDAGLEYI